MYSIVLNDFSRHTDDYCIWICNRLKYNSVSTYVAPICNLYVTKNYCPRTDIDIIAYSGGFHTTLICTNVYVVHNATITTYLASSINHYAAIMVEGQPLVTSVLGNANTGFQRERKIFFIII